MRLRSPFLALALTGLATCAEPTASGRGGPGSLALRIPMPQSLAQFAPGLVVEQVKVMVEREFPSQESSIPLDSTTITFRDNQNSRTARLDLTVVEGDTLGIRVDYLSGTGTTLFSAFSSVIVGPNLKIPSPALQPVYIGPGSNIAFISLSPADSSLSAGDGLSFDPQPFDAPGLPVAQFYISWSTDDPRVPIDARGHITAPTGLTKRVSVTAAAPNGVIGNTFIDILGSEGLGISPDSLEMLPGGTQVFRVTVGSQRSSQFIWSVNGVDGGDAVSGTINTDGLYQAPATPPSPAKLQVCARDVTANTPTSGCAAVIVRIQPSVGADLVVVNDLDVFDSIATHNDGNIRFIKNLVAFSGAGPRSTQKGVLYDRSRGDCLSDEACTDGMLIRMTSTLTQAGYTVSRLDSPARLLSIPASIKLLVLWLPKTNFDVGEVNTIKRFAAEGGRVLFVGEHAGYYTQTGIDVENNLLRDLGSEMFNLGDLYDCIDTTVTFPTINNFVFTTPTTQRAHPLFNGVSRLAYLCASALQLGENDYPLFFDTLNVHLLAGVTKINTTPLSPPTVRQNRPPAPAGPRYARKSNPFGLQPR